ncbi:MAG: hypothetical protein CSB55_03545 [Candidatus Cloacimonadota bacterium]|nr:MAG: hypothetical protein CSB55_03545 [Candidatus Cloacimonadota bacterium]
MKKKVLMAGLIDPGKNDAGKIHFYELANAFKANGNDVDLIVPGNNLGNLKCKADTIFHLPLTYRENMFNIFLLSFLQIVYYFFISSDEYDFVYIRFRLFPCFFIKLINKIKRLRTEIYAEQAGWVEKEIEIQKGNLLIKIIGKNIQIIDAFFADKVIVMTKGIKERLIKNRIKRSKIYVAENGTNTDHFYPFTPQERKNLKNKLLNTDKTILGFTGNLSKWQGIEQLIYAYKKIREENNDLLLLIIGSGIYRDELITVINDNDLSDSVIFRENADYSEINKWMNITDIAFAPKIKELDGITSPLKLRDYAASGNAVISTDIAGIREFAEFGWLKTYNPDNTDELIETIRELIQNKDIIENMSKKSREYALKYFSWNKIADAISSFR